MMNQSSIRGICKVVKSSTISCAYRRLLLFLSFVFAILAPTAFADLESGLILHFDFNENETEVLTDNTGNHPGYLNGPSYVPDGIEGGAYAFDGINDEIIVSNAASLNPSTGITVSAWMNCAGTGTFNGVVLLKGSPPRGNAAQYALIFFPNNLQGVQGKASFSTGVGRWADHYSASTLNLNEWHHLVGAYKSGDLRLYVDGVLAYSNSTIVGSLPVMAGNLFIGSEHSFPSNEFFNGMIDEVRLYERSLTQSEVEELYSIHASNVAPSAALSASPLEGSVPLHVAFDLSGSSDINGDIVLYQLDVNGDGTFDYETNVASIIYHDYLAIGSYTARVRVVDSFGYDDLAEVLIQVANIYDGLVLHFPFDVDGGTFVDDSSTNNNNGWVKGAQYVPDGRCGGAYWFDGIDDEIQVTNHPSLNPTNEITVSAWMRCFNSGTRNGVVMLKGSPPGGNNAQYGIVYFPDNIQGVQGKTSFSLGVGGWHDYYSTHTLDLDIWHHIAGTYKSGQLRLFVNGVKLREVAVSGPIPVMTGHLYIGADHSFPPEYFRGLIDDVRVYNRALEEVEITAIYEDCSNKAPVPALVAVPGSGIAPLKVQLDFSATSDPDDNLVMCEIDKDGDGFYEFTCPEPGSIFVDYTEPGTYYPHLRVCDAFAQKVVTSATVVVYADTVPHAVLTAYPESGVAPLAVTLSGTQSWAVADRSLTVYEYDPDGDGVYDIISSSGTVSFTYCNPGVYTAALRVTDNAGLQGVDMVSISVSAGSNPPQVSLDADPGYGVVPLAVNFTANSSDNGYVVAWRWDFEGDGVIDLITSSNTASHIYTKPGSYVPEVTVVDDSNLSASANVKLLVTEDSSIRLWISTPKDESEVWGDGVSVIGHVAPADQSVGVQFQYCISGSASWVALGDIVYPTPSAYKANWDVTGLVDGTNYQLCAVAYESSIPVVTSEYITVKVSSGGDGGQRRVVETVTGGIRQKNMTIAKDETAVVEISDGTEVVLPAGAIDTNSEVQIMLVGVNTNPISGTAVGLQNINENVAVSLDTDPALLAPIVITIPYDDVDDDGFVDGTEIPETTLNVQYYDVAAGEWRRTLNSIVHEADNYIEATLYHLTEFGLFGNNNLLLAEKGGMLISLTSQSTNIETGAEMLTDGNMLSYWKSQPNPVAVQEFTFAFSDYKGAVIHQAMLGNYGEAETGAEYYSRDISVQVSMDNMAYSTIYTGALPAVTEAQLVSLPVSTGRYVRLQLHSGYSAQAWELSEFAVYGALTSDADADLMEDKWEMTSFNTFQRNGDEDYDGDGLTDRNEYILNGDPNVKDSDGDGASDYEEYIAGTSLISTASVFRIKNSGEPMYSGQSDIVLHWDGVLGKTYRIYFTTNLSQGWASEHIYEVLGSDQPLTFTNDISSTPLGLFKIGVH